MTDASTQRSRANTVLALALAVAVLDCVYLSWRDLALHGRPQPWVTPHTGLCSWTANIDCDPVLVTAEARAFFGPNATLLLGFFGGAAYWWFVGARRWPEHRLRLARTLAFWLGVATLFTLRFWWLLVHLPALCPFCPLNHVFTSVAFAAALLVWRREAREHRGPLHASQPRHPCQEALASTTVRASGMRRPAARPRIFLGRR